MLMAVQPPDALQAWLIFIGIAGTAAGVVFAVAGWIVRRAVVPALRHEIEEQVEPLRRTVDRELGVNGREHEGDEQDRGQPLRVLVLRSSSRVRRVDHELDRMEEQQRAHEVEHVRRDSTWPVAEKG